jgi:hypothetical protein
MVTASNRSICTSNRFGLMILLKEKACGLLASQPHTGVASASVLFLFFWVCLSPLNELSCANGTNHGDTYNWKKVKENDSSSSRNQMRLK